MRLRNTITATLLASGLILAGAASANAASPTLCPNNKVCIFDQADYKALLGYRSGGQGSVNVSRSANDKTSSWSNKSNSNSAWWNNKNSSGACHTMKKKTNKSFVGRSNNDRLTSWRTNGGC